MTNYLSKYAHFTNKFDLDKAASLHKDANWQALNKTDLATLDVIRRYSVKFGAAHLKHDTIAEAIQKSNTTARRAVRKLVKLKIIDRIHYVRPVMNGLGANIYAIRPFENPQKKKDINVPAEKIVLPEAPSEVIAAEEGITPMPTTFFERMKTLLSSTIGEHTHARRFFGVYRQLTLPMLKFSIHAHKGDLFEQLGLQAMLIVVQATKRKKIKNMPGYYAGTLRKLIDQALFNDAFEDYDRPFEGFVPTT